MCRYFVLAFVLLLASTSGTSLPVNQVTLQVFLK